MPKFTNFKGDEDENLLDFRGFTGDGTPHQIYVNGKGGDDTIYLNGYSSKARGGDGNDFIAANHGADKLRGDAGDDLLKGQGGFDHLWGGADNDTLMGGVGNDTLIGEHGMDELIGGNGDDVLYGDMSGPRHKDGSAHRDIFRFDTDDGYDKVRDFAVGQDKIYLHGRNDDAYELSFNGTNSFITYGETTIKLLGVELTSEDIIKVDNGMIF
ncbi:MAG: calcium-binding protein [Pseudomonadota bacterium]